MLRRERDALCSNEPSGLFLSRLWSREQLWLQEAIHKNNYRALMRCVKVFSQGSVYVCVEPFVFFNTFKLQILDTLIGKKMTSSSHDPECQITK